MTDVVDNKIPGVQSVIAVASGKGGVGKSSTAVNLALAAAKKGQKVGLLDADIYGPSIPTMLGIGNDVKPEIKGGNRFVPIVSHGIQTLSIGNLTTEDTPMVWRGPMASGALSQMLMQTLWHDLDILFIDMPPGTGDIQLTLAQKVAVDGAIIVTTPQEIALKDAVKGMEMFNKVQIPVLGLVENMAMHICSNCNHVEHIFGQDGATNMAAKYGTSLLGSLPLDIRIRKSLDLGSPSMIDDNQDDIQELYLSVVDAALKQLERQNTGFISPEITFN